MPVRGKPSGVGRGIKRAALIKARTKAASTWYTGRAAEDLFICWVLRDMHYLLESWVHRRMHSAGIDFESGWGFNIRSRDSSAMGRPAADGGKRDSYAKANRRRRKFLNKLIREL